MERSSGIGTILRQLETALAPQYEDLGENQFGPDLGDERFDCWISDHCHSGCNLMHFAALKMPILE
jgi:hypothetical protein